MKRKILEADLDRREKKVLTEQELEAQERAQAQLERAGALRMEQEEEIRMLNKVGGSSHSSRKDRQTGFGFLWILWKHLFLSVLSLSPQLILDAQCQATRDAQIREKQQVEAEMAEEDKRLDSMMEAERNMALEAEKEIDELRKRQRIR